MLDNVEEILKNNIIVPFKDRTIDFTKKVRVYRNLNKGKDCKVYSIVQSGRTVAHTTQCMLRDVTFKINEKGRQRIIATNQKYFHAYAEGNITSSGMGTRSDSTFNAVIQYNPYVNDSFVCKNLTTDGFKVKGAICVIFNQQGLTGTYLHK